MFKFTGHEALIFKNKYLVISDLHLGIEKELFLKGINIPAQTNKLIEKIMFLKEKFNVKNLIIVGDLKHNVPKISIIELKEVPYFLDRISEEFKKVFVLKGNHDGGLNKIVNKKDNLYLLKELKIGKVVFTHGNRKNKFDGDIFVIGHHHFVISITSSIGESFYEKVIVRGFYNDKEIIILPAFSDLAGNWEIGEFHGPIAKRIENYEVYTLNGILLKILSYNKKE